jgi:flagellar motor protein MotB
VPVKNMIKRFSLSRPLLVTIFLLYAAVTAPAQGRWYEGFFIEGSMLKHSAPEILSEYIQPEPGYRGALGYEFYRFRFAVETGTTHITGTNPLLTEISLTQLIFKLGYDLPLFGFFGLRADAGLGAVFSRVSLYESAVDIILGNLKEEEGRGLLASTRFYLTISPIRFLTFYAGGGADFLFETDGVLPLPLLEMGVSLKPLAWTRPARRERSVRNRIVFESRSENIVIEETEHGRTVRLLNAVYFEANSTTMIERYRSVLNAAGERLRADPSLRITLRGYAAPFGTAESLAELSLARARICADYLSARFGVCESRINIEFFGAQRTPEVFRDATWESYRCVELIIE